MAVNDFLKVSSFSIQFKDQKTLELMVTVANLPGFSLNEVTLARPVVNDRRPGGHLTFEDLNITVNCDESLNAFIEIYSYLIDSANPNTGELIINSNVFDVTMNLLTNKNNMQHKVHFYNAYFKSIGALQFNSTSADDAAIVTFDASLGYSFYNFE